METYDWANPTAKRQRVDAYAEHYQQAQHGADKAAQKQQSGCVAAWNRLSGRGRLGRKAPRRSA